MTLPAGTSEVRRCVKVEAAVGDDDEVLLNVLRCQMTY